MEGERLDFTPGPCSHLGETFFTARIQEADLTAAPGHATLDGNCDVPTPSGRRATVCLGILNVRLSKLRVESFLKLVHPPKRYEGWIAHCRFYLLVLSLISGTFH